MNQNVNYNIADQQDFVELKKTIKSPQAEVRSSQFTEKRVDQVSRNIWGRPHGVDSLSQELLSQNLFNVNIGKSVGLLGGSGENIFSGRKMHKTVHWSIPWSDFMMTMFILFAVMYVYHATVKETPIKDNTVTENGPVMLLQSDTDKEPSRITESNLISKTYYVSKQMLKSKGLNSFASVDLIPNKAVKINLTGDLLFESGKADLKSEAESSLKEIAQIIRKTPYMINLVGHTDDVPINAGQFASNWELSSIRASRVARFMIDKMKLPAERFYVTGHAYFQPIKPNNGPQNRAINRRVEIILTKEKPYKQPSGSRNKEPLGENIP